MLMTEMRTKDEDRLTAIGGPARTAEEHAIVLRGIRKVFHVRGEAQVAVEDLTLSINQGEFFSLLGPSGCGKSTTLRMAAGFEEPTEGSILLYGDDVTDTPPERRDVNLVFQSYALFPHMSVYDNVAYGLRRKRVAKKVVADRVGEMLALVELEGYERRRPSELSGGQQQRVALARALVNQPRALLLDEPLAALDLKLRQAMQLELKRIQREVGITFVYVTHDQSEALTMSDRIAVMNQGRLDQVGTGTEIYERPETRFVANFIGTSNLFSARVARCSGEQAILDVGDDQEVVVPLPAGITTGDDVEVAVRPEKISICTTRPDTACRLSGVVSEVAYLGASITYTVQTSLNRETIIFQQNDDRIEKTNERGDAVWLRWRPEHSYPLNTTDKPE